MRRITRIVITGGPCAGKTTAMDFLRHRYMEQGFRVLCIREAATDLMSGGVTPWNCSTSVFYQQCQMELQAARERIFLQAAESMDANGFLFFPTGVFWTIVLILQKTNTTLFCKKKVGRWSIYWQDMMPYSLWNRQR